jgi:hypothetical protein
MDPVTAPTEEIVQVDAVVDELDVTAPTAVTASPAPAEAFASHVNVPTVAGREYPSLYDSQGTTVIAILLGIFIVVSIQYAIVKMYTTAKNEQVYLTRFVTSLVGLVMGAYITDLLIAGPSTSLLADSDHTLILSFIKDIALMIFAYYFGTKSAQGSSSDSAD